MEKMLIRGLLINSFEENEEKKKIEIAGKKSKNLIKWVIY